MGVSHATASHARQSFVGRRLATALGLALVLSRLAACSPGSGPGAQTTTLADILATGRDGATVVVAGHLTYVAPEERVAYIQDATHGIAIVLGPEGLAAAPGDYVTLAGRVEGTRALAHLTHARVIAAAKSSLPDPPFADPDVFSAGSLNATRVKMAARVQGATRVGPGLSLTFTSRGYEMLAHVRDAGRLQAADLIGSDIRLRGVVEPGKGTPDRVPGGQVLVPSAAEIEFVHHAAAASPASPGPQGPLTSVAAVRGLAPADAARGLPVHVRGRITYHDGLWTVMFVQDASSGIFVYTSQLTHTMPDVLPGDDVDIVGQTGPGDFAPVVVAHTMRIQGHGALPAPLPARLEQLVSGRLDSQLVEITGVVRTASTDPDGHLFFDLAVGESRVPIIVPVRPGTPLPASIAADSQVRVTAVAGTRFNTRRQLIGAAC